MAKTACIVLADGFEEVEAITPIDLLRRGGIEVQVVGLASQEVSGSHNIVIKADGIFCIPPFLPDAVILPGGPGHKKLLNSDIVIEFVKNMFSKGKICAAICAAPTVFGKAGILKGKNVTCFPGYENELNGGASSNQTVVTDGTVITSRGAGTAVPFSLEVISCLTDKETADKVASAIVYRT
jgi:protein deglycase